MHGRRFSTIPGLTLQRSVVPPPVGLTKNVSVHGIANVLRGNKIAHGWGPLVYVNVTILN